MKYFPTFLLVLYAVLFTGCFDILEDISFNRNGSGSYSFTFDMDAMITDPFMKEMMLESFKKDGNMELEEGETVEMDSVLFLKDDPQFAALRDKKTLWETAKMHTVISEEQGKMFVNFSFDFDEAGDITAFFKVLNENKENQDMFSGFNQVIGGSSFVFMKKSLTRHSVPQSDEAMADMNSEDMDMLKMFMTEAKLKTSYHLPGKVKTSSIPNSEVNNNEVAVTVPLLDVMESKAQMDGEIKFKN